MRNKIIELYKTDMKQFCKLLILYYGSGREGFFKRFIDTADGESVFVIEGQLMGIDEILMDFEYTAKKLKTLKKFKLL